MTVPKSNIKEIKELTEKFINNEITQQEFNSKVLELEKV